MAEEEPQVNAEITRPDLEAVLDAYLSEAHGPDWTGLKAWLDEYPYYAAELMDFAAAWAQSEGMPRAHGAEAISGERVAQIARAALDAALAEYPLTSATTDTDGQAAFPGLLDAGERLGLKLRDIARAAGLSAAIVRKLDRRLITAATVPGAVVGRLAEVLHTGAATIQSYLEQPATLADGAQFRAEQTPELARRETFDEAVRKDQLLSNDEKRRLLALGAEGDAEEHR